MAHSARELEGTSSILSLLPSLCLSDSGTLTWPSQLKLALESVASGPETSLVSSGHALGNLICNLREQSSFPPLHSTALDGISSYFETVIPCSTSENFFKDVLPFMANLALCLPDLLNDHNDKSINGLDDYMKPVLDFHQVNLRVLNAQQAGHVFLSQELIAALLVCAFFCLYPSEERFLTGFQYFNFDGLFEHEQKLHCLMHYFERVCKQMPQGMVSYERKVLPQLKDERFASEPDMNFWSSSNMVLCPIKIFESGTIEDDASNTLHVDFANQYLGGGVLFHGCVQEEILFVIRPELLAGMLFMPVMQDNEAIEIVGAERFSSYKGYAGTFTFLEDYIDSRPRDALGRRKISIVAIDALCLPGENQFKNSLMLRELNKAFCGFLEHSRPLTSQWEHIRIHLETQLPEQVQVVGTSQDMDTEQNRNLPSVELELTNACQAIEITTGVSHEINLSLSEKSTLGIATGNWGCGAFGGDVELKSMLQWMAASQAGRPFVHYYTFGGRHGKILQQITEWIMNEKRSVGELWSRLLTYGEERLRRRCKQSLFEWILLHGVKPDNSTM